MLFKYSKYPKAGKEFLRFMMEEEQYGAWLQGASATSASRSGLYYTTRSGGDPMPPCSQAPYCSSSIMKRRNSLPALGICCT